MIALSLPAELYSKPKMSTAIFVGGLLFMFFLVLFVGYLIVSHENEQHALKVKHKQQPPNQSNLHHKIS